MRKATTVIVLAAGLVLVGAGCSLVPHITPVAREPYVPYTTEQPSAPPVNEPSPEPVNAPPTPTPAPKKADFATPITLKLGDAAEFEDGTAATLTEIADSRCKKGMQCIWAGELAPTLHLTGFMFPKDGEDLVLGTVRAKEATVQTYRFQLQDATTDSIVLEVYKTAGR